MALDASQVLGSPQVAGVKVNPRGMAKRVAGNQMGAEGLAGQAAATAMFRGSEATPSQTPDFGRNAFLAVTDDDLALIKLKSGVVTLKFDGVLARVPRAEVAAAELTGGVSPGLSITFRNGDSWQVEVTRPSKKLAESVVEALVATAR